MHGENGTATLSRPVLPCSSLVGDRWQLVNPHLNPVSNPKPTVYVTFVSALSLSAVSRDLGVPVSQFARVMQSVTYGVLEPILELQSKSCPDDTQIP